MRTRKTFIHEDGIYEGVFRLPEPSENRPKEVVSLNDAYDWYPEKLPAQKMDSLKFESASDLPLGEEYKLKSQIDDYSHSKYRDSQTMAAQNEEINNLK